MRIYKRGRIYWVAYHDVSTREHKRVSTHLTDRVAALAFGARLERHGADPDGQAAAEATLAGALDNVIAEYEARAKEGTNAKVTVEFYRKRASQLLRMVANGVLPERLSAIGARHVDAMIDARRAEGVKRYTIAKDLIVLRLALKLAKRRKDWFGDVDAVLPHRFKVDYAPRERWLTRAELWALLAELRPDRAAWVAFAVATGANLSETQKARRADVTFANKTPTKVHVRGTKREARDREVPIVKPWQERLLTAALASAGTDALWASWTKMTRDVHLACARAGIARVSSNDLRRTFATWMRADGVRLDDLAPMMGHVDTRMLQQVYARLDVEQLRVLVEGQAVRPVYVDSPEATVCADSEDTPGTCKLLEFGSSCWTRTSDPVINSPGPTPEVSGAWTGACTPSVRADLGPLPGLAKAAATAIAAWDSTEAFAFALAEACGEEWR
jgi:integrase